MRQVTKKGLMTVAAAGSVLAATGGYAYASGADGVASHSPGVGSGNTVQVPVEVPVNVCGNTVNVVGLLNPASGNQCSNGSEGRHHGRHGHHGHGGQGRHEGGWSSGHQAEGRAEGSPGVASGNVVQAPVDVPVNACGLSVDVVGIGNPAMGNDCVNGGDTVHREHGGPEHPQPHQPPCDHGDEHHPGQHNPPAQHHNPPQGEHAPPAEHSVHHNPAGPAQPVTEVKDAHRPAQHAAAPEVDSATQLAHTGAAGLGAAGAASAGLLLGGTMLYRRTRAGQN
ncbi:chaplin [Streptomyces sp. NPDC052396]|uniref:chaplin n=1 Tax=Streptomyces sp. NPDC052396 TaxID=3365689 RepID=UPI0037D7080E